MTMLQYHSVKEMHSSFGDVFIVDGKGDQWVFSLGDIIGIRQRNGAVEIEFAGVLMDHRFIMEYKEQSK